MRQYADGQVFLVPHTSSTTGANSSIIRDAPNDGSQWNVETDNGWASSASATQTFTLGSPAYSGGPSLVSSFAAEWDGGSRAPASFLLEASVDGVTYSTLGSYTLPADYAGGADLLKTFTPTSAKFIRYTATGPVNGDNRFGLTELKVYMAPAQSIETDDGYNILQSLESAGQLSKGSSSNQTPNFSHVWAAPNGGGAADMVDGRVNQAETKAQNDASGTYFGSVGADTEDRAYMIYQLTNALRMDFATLGGSKGQDLRKWELYTSNSIDSRATLQVALDALADNEITDLTGLGWTLQHTQIPPVGGQPAYDFLFNNPGSWKNVLFVWDIQQDGLRELEIFAVPEPTSIGLLGLVGVAALRRKR